MKMGLPKIQKLMEKDDWEVTAAVKHQSSMREEPGQGSVTEGVYAQELTIIDLSASWQFSEQGTAQVMLTNPTR